MDPKHIAKALAVAYLEERRGQIVLTKTRYRELLAQSRSITVVASITNPDNVIITLAD